jgi:hypothetical protein
VSQRPARARRRQRRLLALLALVAAAAGAFFWMQEREHAAERRLAHLEATRDALRSRLATLRTRDPVVASAPAGDLLIGVPEAAFGELLRLATRSLAPRLDVELHELRLQKAGTARVGTPFGRKTAGAYRLDAQVHEVEGTLEPGPPEARFSGRRIDVAVPMRLARGKGRATLRFRWESKGMAGAVCGDLQARIPVEGTLVPQTYPVKGSFALDLADGGLVAVPSFPDLEMRLVVEPGPSTWQALDRFIAQRSWRCRAALGIVDVPGLVRRLLQKGLPVKIPSQFFKPLRLPASAARQVTLEGRTYRLEVAPRELAVGPRLVWYAADVSTRRADRPAAAPSPTPPPPEPAPSPSPTPSPTPAVPGASVPGPPPGSL